jgi:bis(5'-adenosyl)-triphosphatase
MDCPFCFPTVWTSVFAFNANFLGVYNLAPILPGHSLIVPRKHYHSIFEMSDPELSEMIVFTKKVTELLTDTFHAEAFNWSLQEKESAGQSVAHLHLHVVPRYQGDMPDPGDWYPMIRDNFGEILDSSNREKLSDQEMRQVVSRLRILAEERQLYFPG